MTTVESRTDEQLMGMLRDGHDDALGELIGRYQNDVFRFCLHYLRDVEVAKELCQETFLRVYTARERFDVQRKFKPWVLRIARNLSLNELKRKKTVRMETLELYASNARQPSGELLRSDAESPAEQAMARERRELLMRAIEGLPEAGREVVKLRFFERMSAREIAAIVDSTEGAVRTRLHRSLKLLRETRERIGRAL